jgi:hypothetical protein
MDPRPNAKPEPDEPRDLGDVDQQRENEAQADPKDERGERPAMSESELAAEIKRMLRDGEIPF